MTSSSIEAAFEQGILVVPLHAIVPRKPVSDSLKRTIKYRRIVHSIEEVGIVEPLVVARHPQDKLKYLLLDGHLRREALFDRGEDSVCCIVSRDDEAFTYNKRINRLATVQEHYMIVRALDRGVPEAKLARALDVNIKFVRRRKTLLNGLCVEAIKRLKDKPVNPATFDVLRKMNPTRQIEVIDQMACAGNFTTSFARALLIATAPDKLSRPPNRRRIPGLMPDQKAQMAHEMQVLQKAFAAAKTSYGSDVLSLVIASRHVSNLVENKRINRYLQRNCPEILEGFIEIVNAVSLDQASIGPESM
ncbi:MAG: ParB N-terminal domain-containing protein [Xanthobacteraceae bacterium]|nr:ParB N-terminal domain-containing protein [Xanthobacteraceae bacterium]